MANLYEKIEMLCAEKKTNITVMCREASVSRAALTELKMGRSKTLSNETLLKIANHFNVTVDFLLGQEKNPATKDSSNDTRAFFRLKKGLESYDLSDADVNFLLTVYKAHKDDNK